MDNRNAALSPSLGEIAGGLAGDVQDLVRGEIALAKAELDQKARTLITAIISLLGGALTAFAGLVVLLEGGAAALAVWIPAWAALVIVGAVIILVGGLIARGGLAGISLKALTPDQSISSVQKDVRMIRDHG